MREISCAVVDDEPLAVKLIESFIERTPFLKLAASFTDSVDAMTELKTNPVDLLFLDIQMPDMDGMELSHVIPPSTRIIFTTAFKEYAFDSYDVSALDFLLKPIRYDKFLRASEKAKEWFALKDNTENSPAASAPTDMYIRVDGELKRINVDKILYVEGLKDYVRFHFADAPHSLITHLTMKSVEDTLPSDKFMRVSRSFIVALDHIRSVDRNMCIYTGNAVIKVTDMYRQEFENFIKLRTAR